MDNNYSVNLDNLRAKGGIMLFSVQRPDKLYRGIILLSPLRHNHRKKIICMREFALSAYADK